MGFDAVFFARIDYQDYAVRNTSKQLEMVRASMMALDLTISIFFIVVASVVV
jgi:hypothetical protein